MRKIIVSMSVSLDGYFEGPNREIDWHMVDEESNQYAIATLNTVDTILFGRVMYQLFERYWPGAETDPAMSPSDVVIAHKINTMKKIVYSRTLESVAWHNSTLVREFVPEEVAKMKQQPGQHISAGGGEMIRLLMRHGLIDEYRLLVHPLVLGSGKRLFNDESEQTALRLVASKAFASGVVVLTYVPATT